MPELASVRVGGMTRSAFLLRATLAAGAVAGAAAVAPFATRALAQTAVGDAEILNFALTLELLEARFYTIAVEDVPGLSGAELRLARELRDNELEHVDALRETVGQLGATPVPEPDFDFGDAFASVDAYLKLANTLEDTGVSAYNGAAPNIQSEDILAAAGAIVQVEGRHAALIRLQRGEPPAPLSFDVATDMDEVLMAVQPFLRS